MPANTIKTITVQDPLSHSADVVADNVAKLKAMFPELLTEGANGASVNIDVLRQLVGDQNVTDAEEKFGLNWHGKRRARQLALTPSTGTLRPSPEDSVNWDTTQNLFSEGDNLEGLKRLQKSYAGRVKLIYIDPPYNTGKDFVYSDDYQDSLRNYQSITGQRADGVKLTTNTEASGRFHTDWLRMMYPRLRAARDMLRQDGVIFISIDDSELAHLRAVCDDVFGSENLCGVIKRRAARKTAFLSKRMTDMCDYVVAYVKSDAAAPLTAGQVSDGTRPVFNEGNGISERKLRSGAIAKCGDGRYPAGSFAARSLSFEYLDELIVAEGRVKTEVRVRGPWRINQDVLDQTLFVTRNRALRRTMMAEELGKAKLLNDLLDESEFYNEKGSEELSELLGCGAFSNPKPRALIEYLMAAAGVTGDDIVCDFFAGSGTCGHAVFAANAADSQRRRFILVQLPEPLDANVDEQKVAAEFCRQLGKPLSLAEVTKERLRRAAKAVSSELGGDAADSGFRVFRLDTSNVREWHPSTPDVAAALAENVSHLHATRSDQDVLYELLLKRGLDLCVPIEEKTIAGKTVHSIGAGSLITCLDGRIARDDGERLALGIAKWHKEISPAGETAVVFRDDAFADDVVKTNVAAILDQHGLKNVRSI